jgi:rubredoxin
MPGDDAYVNWNRPGRLSGTLLDQLPARVVCPTCGARPLLTADKLRAQPYVVAGATLTAVDGDPVSETCRRPADPAPGVLYVDL